MDKSKYSDKKKLSEQNQKEVIKAEIHNHFQTSKVFEQNMTINND